MADQPGWAVRPAGRPAAAASSTSTASSAARHNQWYPALYEGTTPVEPPTTPEEGYHLTEDLTDKAIGWIGQQKALMPDKPFFVYFAPGATHAPHHVPQEWADKYKGKFDDGWDALREETFARQKELGVDPAGRRADRARTRRSRPGTTCPRSSKPVLAPPDGGLRRLPGAHRPPRRPAASTRSRTWACSTTRSIYYIIGDNGASAEGTLNGAFNEMINFNGAGGAGDAGVPDSRSWTSSAAPSSYNHYAVGWAHAMDTPYQWTKQVASHWGGTRNGTIVHWPDGHRGEGRAAPRSSPT